MEREFVQSTAIISVGYEPSTEILEVEISGGAVYQYANVPAAIHQQLMESDSKGKFFNAYIRNTYPCSPAWEGILAASFASN